VSAAGADLPGPPTGTAARARPAAAWWPLALAVALPLAFFAWQGRIGLSLWDEGYLWYGAQRVLHGEVPLRDFQSYDPARYYWSAAWLAALGSDGIVALRFGNAVLASLCGALAAWLLGLGGRHSSVFTGLTVVAVSLFVLLRAEGTSDAFGVLLQTAALAFALARPQRRRRWLLAGTALGIATAIGINHALYGTLGLALAAVHLWRRGLRRELGRGIGPVLAGVVLGYLPVLAMFATVDGFASAFVDSIRMLFEWGTTNLDLPLVPRSPLLATLFFVAAAFWLVGAFVLAVAPRSALAGNPAFAAAVLTGLPYAHYAVSRNDLEHLSVSVLPVLVAAATMPWKAVPVVRALAMAGVVWLAAALVLPRQAGRWAWEGWPLETTTIRGETVRLKPWEAAEVRLLREMAARHPGRAFYAAPYWPGAYAVQGARSPTWEIYALFPSTRVRQARELERINAADVAFALVSDARVDDRSDLGFRRTHGAIVDWLDRCLQQVTPPFDAVPIRGVRVLVDDDIPCERPTARR
jgi:hypothetical protein